VYYLFNMVKEQLKAATVKGLDGYLGFLDTFIDEIATEVGLSDSICGDMVMALSEALNNAYHHGHNSDKDKDIMISVYTTGKELIVVVADQGDGFEYDLLRTDLSEELIDLPGGRGLFIMRALAKDVLHNDKGNEVTLLFDLVA